MWLVYWKKIGIVKLVLRNPSSAWLPDYSIRVTRTCQGDTWNCTFGVWVWGWRLKIVTVGVFIHLKSFVIISNEIWKKSVMKDFENVLRKSQNVWTEGIWGLMSRWGQEAPLGERNVESGNGTTQNGLHWGHSLPMLSPQGVWKWEFVEK